jgi:hypothetical protein
MTQENGRHDIAVITFNAVPGVNPTLKYERLGRMAVENRAIYCARHGYRLIHQVELVPDRPACWSKIPAMLQALEDHDWVCWADSDAIVIDHARGLEQFCLDGYDMVVQSPLEFFRCVRLDPVAALARMPINTGVFLMRRSAWSLEFLRDTFRQTDLVTRGDVWDGIGEQEAMIRLLRSDHEHRNHVGYVDHLQNHPKLFREGDLFVHFYGNHARHRLSREACEEVLSRWERADAAGGPYPRDLARFHWACIQAKDAGGIQKWDLEHFLYAPEDIEA